MKARDGLLREQRDEIAEKLETALSRLDDRREKVFFVASLLFFEYGHYPSVGLVREFTRHGSFTDIRADLDLWWESLREKGRGRLELQKFPAVLGERIEKMAETLWQDAQDVALASFDEERAELEDRIAQGQSELAQGKKTLKAAHDEIESLRKSMIEETRKGQALAQALSHRDGELAAARERIEALGAQLKQADLAREALSQQFSRDLAAERKARERDTEILQGEVKFAKMQIEQARQGANDLREHNTQLKEGLKASEALITTLTRRAREAEDRVIELRERLDAATAKKDIPRPAVRRISRSTPPKARKSGIRRAR